MLKWLTPLIVKTGCSESLVANSSATDLFGIRWFLSKSKPEITSDF
jgi:hypothetical protein